MKSKKKIKYIKPKLEIIKLDKEDIITTSTLVTDALWGKGKDGVKI